MFGEFARLPILTDVQKSYRIREIGRARGLEGQPLAAAGMNERQFVRVKHYPRRFVAGQLSETPVLPLAIGFVANKRVADELEMDANLVRPARVDRDTGQREHGMDPLRAEDARDRLAAAPRA